MNSQSNLGGKRNSAHRATHPKTGTVAKGKKTKGRGLQDFTIKTIAISRINPATYNPRRDFTEDELKAFEANLDKFGCVELLVWNEKTGNLVGGHKRFEWLKKKGATTARVAVVDLNDKDEKTLNLALNKHGEGLWDEEKLEVLLEELQVENIDIELSGFEIILENEENLELETPAFESKSKITIKLTCDRVNEEKIRVALDEIAKNYSGTHYYVNV